MSALQAVDQVHGREAQERQGRRVSREARLGQDAPQLHEGPTREHRGGDVHGPEGSPGEVGQTGVKGVPQFVPHPQQAEDQ